MNQTPQPNNKRSTMTDELELRKLWHIPKAEYIYALAIKIKIETAELIDNEPNWDNIITTDYEWQVPQGYVGDEDWAHSTAEHFGLVFPVSEYKPTEEEANQ